MPFQCQDNPPAEFLKAVNYEKICLYLGDKLDELNPDAFFIPTSVNRVKVGRELVDIMVLYLRGSEILSFNLNHTSSVTCNIFAILAVYSHSPCDPLAVSSCLWQNFQTGRGLGT